MKELLMRVRIEGDEIETTIDIYYYSTSYGYELVFGDVDVSSYVKNNR
jgi:hypothetical protein